MNPDLIVLGQRLLARPLMMEPRSVDVLQSLLTAPERGTMSMAKSMDHGAPDGIAIIPVTGPLVKRGSAMASFFGFTSYDSISEQLAAALDDTDVHTILLDIDSPGGESAGVFDLADQIYEARNHKHIVAVANESAFSAAYAIASAADQIYLSRTGGVGSIGVIAAHFDQTSYNEKVGIKITHVYAGARKNDFTPHAPLSDEAHKTLQEEVNRTYELFADQVARNRHLPKTSIRKTEAGLFFGDDAVTAGLADGVMTMGQVINLLTTQRKDFSMNKPKAEAAPVASVAEEKTPDVKTDVQPKPQIDETVLKQEAETAVRQELQSYTEDVIAACELAGFPLKALEYLKANKDLKAVKEDLLKAKEEAANQPIASFVQPQTATGYDFTTNPVVEEAKARAEKKEG